MNTIEKEAQIERTETGSFVGFVLLKEAGWDKEQFKQDFRSIWGADISGEEPTVPDSDGSGDLVFSMEGMIAAVSLMPAPVPNREAEENAAYNYLWPQAADSARAHKAHLLVAVLGQDTPLLERGKLFVKLMSACCKQPNVLGVYTSGTVFQPEFYQGFSEVMLDGELPVFNWIWFGLSQNERGVSAYTYGLDVFGKDEIEVLDADVQPGVLRDFMSCVAAYVLEGDVVLKDGETIGFTEDQHLSITRSPGVYRPGMTLKLGCEGTSGK